MKDITFRCCFCNTHVHSTNVDPCDINILINIDKPKDKQDNQTFYCHADCFKNILHKDLKGLFIVDLVDD